MMVTFEIVVAVFVPFFRKNSGALFKVVFINLFGKEHEKKIGLTSFHIFFPSVGLN